jgi:hypothetical protein
LWFVLTWLEGSDCWWGLWGMECCWVGLLRVLVQLSVFRERDVLRELVDLSIFVQLVALVVLIVLIVLVALNELVLVVLCELDWLFDAIVLGVVNVHVVVLNSQIDVVDNDGGLWWDGLVDGLLVRHSI